MIRTDIFAKAVRLADRGKVPIPYTRYICKNFHAYALWVDDIQSHSGADYGRLLALGVQPYTELKRIRRRLTKPWVQLRDGSWVRDE